MVRNQEIKIKEYWDRQAELFGDKIEATMPDLLAKELEIKTLLKYCRPNEKILDAGCGNGYSAVELAKRKNLNITGVDYSEKMIKYAGAQLKGSKLKGKVKFEVGDVLNLRFGGGAFDKVITDRCLINLPTFEHQLKAAKELHRVLKTNGIFLMMEDTQQGLKKLNTLRKKFGLYEIKIRWHDLYIDEKKFLEVVKPFFKLVKIDNFASTYYMCSRIINAKLTPPGEEPDYLSPINKIAARLPPLGDYTALKLFVLEKR